MKHLWFGVGLLAALLAASLWLGDGMEALHEDPARDLEKAADAALAGDWDLAEALYIRSANLWQRRRSAAAVLIHHDAVDEIEMGFSALRNYIRCKEVPSFTAACSQLAYQLRSIPQSHRFRWWNLL